MTQREREVAAMKAARADGWMYHPGSDSTKYRYYVKDGRQTREDRLVELYATEYIAHDFCGWMEQYGRFTHCPSGDTLRCRQGMGQDQWDRAQLEFFTKYPGINVHKCLEGPYSTRGEIMGTTEEICTRLRSRLGV